MQSGTTLLSPGAPEVSLRSASPGGRLIMAVMPVMGASDGWVGVN